MPKKPLETLSEPMFYVLMALRRRSLCGAEALYPRLNELYEK